VVRVRNVGYNNSLSYKIYRLIIQYYNKLITHKYIITIDTKPKDF